METMFSWLIMVTHGYFIVGYSFKAAMSGYGSNMSIKILDTMVEHLKQVFGRL